VTGLNRGASHFEPLFTLTAGPAGATLDTLAALGHPVLYHYDPAFLELHAEAFDFVGTRQSLKRRAVPDDIAPAVAFLASEEAGWVTGSTVNVDGGHVRH
jgi:3-oxoacyl-[acyl-carrier protein] reductase/pyridoxal 4-dehydrogenase